MTIVMRNRVPMVELTVDTVGQGEPKPKIRTPAAKARWAMVIAHPATYAMPSKGPVQDRALIGGREANELDQPMEHPTSAGSDWSAPEEAWLRVSDAATGVKVTGSTAGMRPSSIAVMKAS